MLDYFFSGPFINTETYSTAELLLYFGGWILWVPVYAVVILRLFRDHYVEIPVVAATGNVAWEFLWGFVFIRQDMGWGLQVIYMGACIMDGFILYGVVRYGAEQFGARELRIRWPAPAIFMLVIWTVWYVGFIEQGDDLPLGSVTAYTVNLVMSVAYLYYGLVRDPQKLSLVAAWFKGLGTGLVSVFVFIKYDHLFVESLAVVVGVLDAAYIALLYYQRSRLRSAGGADSAADFIDLRTDDRAEPSHSGAGTDR